MAAPPLLLPPRRRPARNEPSTATQGEIAREQWDEYKRLGVPIQESLAAEASAPISESEYATNIGRAGADVDQAYDQAGTEFRSSLGRYGLNPGSGRFASGLRSLALGRAADKSGAMTGARGALESRRDQLRHGVLAGLQGQAGQAQAGPRVRGGRLRWYRQPCAAMRRNRAQQEREANRQVWVSVSWLGTGLMTAAAMFFSDPQAQRRHRHGRQARQWHPDSYFPLQRQPERSTWESWPTRPRSIRPEAVGRHKSGLAVVDYMKVAA